MLKIDIHIIHIMILILSWQQKKFINNPLVIITIISNNKRNNYVNNDTDDNADYNDDYVIRTSDYIVIKNSDNENTTTDNDNISGYDITNSNSFNKYQIEEPQNCWYCSTFDYFPNVPNPPQP